MKGEREREKLFCNNRFNGSSGSNIPLGKLDLVVLLVLETGSLKSFYVN